VLAASWAAEYPPTAFPPRFATHSAPLPGRAA
jgi:hypothetical protein